MTGRHASRGSERGGAVLAADAQNCRLPIVLLAVIIVVANLLVDVLYGVLDPRIRYE